MQEVIGSTPLSSTNHDYKKGRGFFMLCFVYIIYSVLLDQYYIGSSEDIVARLYRHNNSGSKFTKRASDWQLVYREEFATRSEAIKENWK